MTTVSYCRMIQIRYCARRYAQCCFTLVPFVQQFLPYREAAQTERLVQEF